MTDTNIADALAKIETQLSALNTAVVALGTPAAPVIDFTPVTDAIAAATSATVAGVKDIIDAIDTPTPQPDPAA